MSTSHSDNDRYMPASHRIKRELAELLRLSVTDNFGVADMIEELIKAVIDEREYDRSPNRQED